MAQRLADIRREAGAAASRIPSADDTNPPGGIYSGLSADELKYASERFNDITAAFGIDGVSIFKRLASGQSIRQALSIPPEVVEAIYTRAHSWFSLARFDRALTLFKALCVLDGDSADYWVGYGVCLRILRQPANAQRAFDNAALLRPEWEIPHFHALELAVSERWWQQAGICLAAFEARQNESTPATIAHEANRMRIAIETQRENISRLADTETVPPPGRHPPPGKNSPPENRSL